MPACQSQGRTMLGVPHRSKGRCILSLSFFFNLELKTQLLPFMFLKKKKKGWKPLAPFQPRPRCRGLSPARTCSWDGSGPDGASNPPETQATFCPWRHPHRELVTNARARPLLAFAMPASPNPWEPAQGRHWSSSEHAQNVPAKSTPAPSHRASTPPTSPPSPVTLFPLEAHPP